MTRRALLLAGSPTENSRSSGVLDAFGAALVSRGFELERYGVRSFPSEALLEGKFDADVTDIAGFDEKATRCSEGADVTHIELLP